MRKITSTPISDLDGKSEATRSVPVVTLTGDIKWFDVSDKEFKAHTDYMARFPEAGGAKVPGLPSLVAKSIETETTTETAEAAPVVPLTLVDNRPAAAAGRRTGTTRPGNRRSGDSAPSSGPVTETQRIREWARERGDKIAERGALPRGLKEEYQAAMKATGEAEGVTAKG